MVWFTKFVVRSLNAIARHVPSREPEHLLTGRRGELEAYLHLRSLGYRIVASNFRVPRNRGEVDLVAWDAGVLCFVEVKTRTSAEFAPPSTAVDLAKKHHILAVARRYVRRLPGNARPPCRFDIVSVILAADGANPQITLHKGAYSWDAGWKEQPRGGNWWRRDGNDRRFWRRRP